MYKKVNPNMNVVQSEEKIIKFWKENHVFEESVSNRVGNDEFSFYDGPPTANGKPHVGHVLTRTMKDVIPRYHTMKGDHCVRIAGWDTHGLPVEIEIEKTLGIDSKQDIEKYGVEPFIEKCKQSVWKYKAEWERMSERVGYWADMEHPYVTYDNDYIESVWWSLKSLFDRGLIYHGYKVVPYCPRCGTSLSSHEVAQGYKEVEERSAVVAFRVSGTTDTYILAWTTTPWTLPSNVALCLNPDFDYATIEANGKKYILAKELISSHFEEYKIISQQKGKELVGIAYEPLYNCYSGNKRVYYTVCDKYVTLSEGTGIVHIAPAFGEDDARVGRDNDLPFVQMVSEQGKFKDDFSLAAGIFCKDADKIIINDLKERGLLKDAPLFKHSYPFCWRCDTPLLYYARATWFIKTTAIKDELLKNNASVNWLPPSIGTGRMGNFLENVVDWGVSRERYWGTPLPLWICDKCGKIEAIGSRKQLSELTGAPEDIELHKPHVDNLTYKCGCGGTMRRTTEVIDCWYDAGSMPFAQYHYPFENKDLFEQTFPADFICEAIDQTRGWFYTLLVISTLMFGKAPFKNCVVLGHVNDEFGRKMSKHTGNGIAPFDILNVTGADAVRWYFYTNSAPYLPSRFYEKAVVEAQNKYLGTLKNTYSFYVLYAEIDKFNPRKYNLDDCKLQLIDKWLLSKLNELVAYVDKGLSEYKIYESARAMNAFVDKLSNWYVRRNRERFWSSGMSSDKIAAYMTLYTALETMSRLTAPFTPFIAEDIYRNIVCSVDKTAPKSVHLCSFPEADTHYIDESLSSDMDKIIKAAELGRSARSRAAIKSRQPLSLVMVGGKDFPTAYDDILADELNVKKVERVTDTSAFSGYDVKPQLKTVGPKYGKLVNSIRTYLAANSALAGAAFDAGKDFEFSIDGNKIVLAPDDMLVNKTGKAGFVVEEDGGITVAIDITVTDELRAEGIVRELISKIQTMRKDAGFEVTDRITIGYSAGADIKAAFKNSAKKIKEVTLADSISESIDGYEKQWDINGEQVTLSVKKC